MEEIKHLFNIYLTKRGLKLTKSRNIILDAIFINSEHFNVDSLYDRIKLKHNNVSRATIYRTMPLLIEAGLVKQALRCQAKDHYESIYNQPSHLHLICINCGKIIEINSSEIEKILQKIATKEKFKIKEYNVGVKGLCKDCKKAKR